MKGRNLSEYLWNMNTITANSTVLPKNEWNFSVTAIFIISIYSVNIPLSFPLNIYIIGLLIPGRGALEPCDIFCLNQALAEIFFVFLSPFHILCSLNLCLFKPGFLLAFTMCSRSLFQCCVCLEHYLAVLHPMTFLRYKPARYQFVCSIVTWIWSLATGFIGMLTFPYMPYHVFAVMCLLVLIVDIFCCASILKRLKHPGPRDMESKAREMNSAKKKAFEVVSVNLLIFLLQYFPISVAFTFKKQVSEDAFDIAVVICLALNTTMGFLQPVYMVYRAGKLLLAWSVCFPSPFCICCIRSETTNSSQCIVGK